MAGIAVMLSGLLACYGCSAPEVIESNDIPLSELEMVEEDPLYSQTLDSGAVISSDSLDVTTMDFTISTEKVTAPEEAQLPKEAVDVETATGSLIADNILTGNLSNATMGVALAGTPSTAGGLTINGGTVNTDFTHAANQVVIKTSTPLTLSGTFTGTVQVASGVEAWITLNGVTITSNSVSSPINLLSNSKAHIILADGTTNTISANGQGCAGIHCGDGSYLWIDDSVVNYDFAAKKHIDVLYGKVATDGVVTNMTDGTSHAVTVRDVLTNVDSAGKIGKLIVKGGKNSSGIGSGPNEIAGNMTFDGGYIESYSWGGHSNNGGNNNAAVGTGVTNAEGSNVGESSGTGIGAGSGPNAGATDMTFNGGTIYAFGSYHGAGIGAGWSSIGSPNTQQTGASSSTRNKLNCGNININGGYILSQGYAHGNAFGGACGTNMNGSTVRITGGTLRPFSHSSKKDIGGSGGYVIIDGGSISLSGAQSAKFQSVDNKAYSDVARTQEVVPVEVDLSAQTGPVDFNITKWTLLIDGKVYQYGAPSKFNAGKLTLWLPPTAKTQKVEVQLNYFDSTTGAEVLVEPLYREPGSTSSNVKRNVYFDMPYDAIFGNPTLSDETLPTITNFPNELLVDGKIPTSVKTLAKEYDGLPFKTAKISEIDGGLSITESHSKETRTLTNDEYLTYSYRLLNGNTFSDELTAAQMPSDTGLMAFAMNSSEYAQDAEWGKSYIGHRSNGWVRITPVPAILTIESAEWGYLDTSNGSWTPTLSKEDQPGNRIKVSFNVRSAIGTMPTCKVPTGAVQLFIGGKKFGEPLTLTEEWIEQDGFSTYDVIEGPSDESANTEAAIASAENRWTAKVTYYMDPANADGLLAPRSIKTSSKSDAVDDNTDSNPITDALENVVDLVTGSPEKAVAAVEDVDESQLQENEYKLTSEYIPDKNYIEGVERNPQNADATATIIIPVDPSVKITDDQGTTYEEKETTPTPSGEDENGNPVDENGNPIDPDHKFYTSSIVKNYSDFHKIDAAGNETIEKDYFTLLIETNSDMPVEYTTSDPSVADFVRDGEGNVVLDENGNPKVRVLSCGKVTLSMHQNGNAIYNETTHIVNMTVIPDESLKPDTEARVIERNLTHPGMPAAPGDVIEYTVIGSNLTDGSAWQDVELGSVVSKYLTVNEDSFTSSKNFSTPDNLDGLTADMLDGLDWRAMDQHTSSKDNVSGATSVGGALGSIYGGQSSAIRFTATVSSNIVDRDAIEGDNPPSLPNDPTAQGSYGVKETEDLVPGEDAGSPIPVTDTKLIGIPDTATPEAKVIPRNPVLSGDNADMYVNKTAENTTRSTGVTVPGDTIHYTITVGNKAMDTCLYYPVIHDALPAGVEPVLGTFELTHVDGSKTQVQDSVYNAKAHTIALYIDDLYGGEEATLEFDCIVSDQATYLENTAQMIGTMPSDKWKQEEDKTDPDPVDPAPGIDKETAIEILGGTIVEEEPGEGEDPAPNPSPEVGNVIPGSPFDNAKKADDDDPSKPLLSDPDDPSTTTPNPIKEGDKIIKFGDKNDPTSDDIVKELDEWIKKALEENPDADEVDIPVTIQRTDPETGEETTENVIVTIPIPENIKNPGTPDIDMQNPPVPGDPWIPSVPPVIAPDTGEVIQPDPSTPVDPWDGFDWEDFVEKDGLPEGKTDEPATPGVFVPNKDPQITGADADLKVSKIAEPIDKHDDGKTYVGDFIRYTITVTNDRPGTAWYNAIVRDNLPEGLTIDMNTAKIIFNNGSEIAISKKAYDYYEHMLIVNVGDIMGGESVKVVFDAMINDKALESSIGNTANAYGTPPTEVTPNEIEDGSKPTPGTPAEVPDTPKVPVVDENGTPVVDENGNPVYKDPDESEGGVSIKTETPVYPSEIVKNDGVEPPENNPDEPSRDPIDEDDNKPDPNDPDDNSNLNNTSNAGGDDNGNNTVNTSNNGNGGIGSGDNDMNSELQKTPSNPIEWLVQTGDPIMFTIIGASVAAAIAIGGIVLVRRRNKK